MSDEIDGAGRANRKAMRRARGLRDEQIDVIDQGDPINRRQFGWMLAAAGASVCAAGSSLLAESTSKMVFRTRYAVFALDERGWLTGITFRDRNYMPIAAPLLRLETLISKSRSSV